MEHVNTVRGQVYFLRLSRTMVKFISKIGSLRMPVTLRFGPIYRRICKISKKKKKTICFFMCVCLSVWTNWRILTKFNVLLFLENLSIKWNFVKIWQGWRLLYMKTYVHLWLYLARLFLESQNFQRKVVQKIKTHFMFSIFFFFRNPSLYKIR